MFLSFLCCLSLLLAPHVTALVMPHVFGSHMVLQRAPLRAKLWGEATPSSKVACVIDSEPAVVVQADDSGRFLCELLPHPLSWNRTVTVTADAEEALVFVDVAFGDVVLCLGQSNMELSINYTFGGSDIIQDSINHPAIRLFTVAWNKSPMPLNDTVNRWSGESWRVASPDALDCGLGCSFYYFASTCYYYGLAIDIALQGSVPLGLMQVTYGGTWVEEWTRAAVVPQCGQVPHAQSTTGQIWNGMMWPVVNITTQLTLWYQGETNTDSSNDALHYGCMFRAMINDLRRHQRGTDSPFYFVLLAPARNGTNGSLPLIQGWNSQLEALSMPNTAVANTIDLGDWMNPLINELHPRNKSLIGRRLARIALNELYGQPMVARGPSLDPAIDVRVEWEEAGQQVRVVMRFPESTENSLLHVINTAECITCCDGHSSALFGLRVVNGSDNRIAWPVAVDIDVEQREVQALVLLPAQHGQSGPREAATPRWVHIDFENAVSYPECALYNEANLPALPFSAKVQVSEKSASHTGSRAPVMRVVGA